MLSNIKTSVESNNNNHQTSVTPSKPSHGNFLIKFSFMMSRFVRLIPFSSAHHYLIAQIQGHQFAIQFRVDFILRCKWRANCFWFGKLHQGLKKKKNNIFLSLGLFFFVWILVPIKHQQKRFNRWIGRIGFQWRGLWSINSFRNSPSIWKSVSKKAIH